MNIGKRIIGTQNASYYKGSDGVMRLLTLRMVLNRIKTRNLYEKQRALCGAIKINWQRQGLAK